MLTLTNIFLRVQDKTILQNLSLELKRGSTHVIMGPNGSGKSTLTKLIAGHPQYQDANGMMTLDGENIQDLIPEERAARGIFLGFQSPPLLAGITLFHFLQSIWQQKIMRETGKTIRELRRDKEWRQKISRITLKKRLTELLQYFSLPKDSLDRDMGEGFSGGERKKIELIQMTLLEPKLVLLDEIDSGVDITAIKSMFPYIFELQKKHEMTILLITHNPLIANALPKESLVHLFRDGSIQKTGSAELIAEIVEKGFLEETR